MRVHPIFIFKQGTHFSSPFGSFNVIQPPVISSPHLSILHLTRTTYSQHPSQLFCPEPQLPVRQYLPTQIRDSLHFYAPFIHTNKHSKQTSHLLLLLPKYCIQCSQWGLYSGEIKYQLGGSLCRAPALSLWGDPQLPVESHARSEFHSYSDQSAASASAKVRGTTRGVALV